MPVEQPRSTIGIEPPRIIQGGMGIGVSNWTLARAVSRLGHLGVVSGTAVDTVFIRRLQDGDAGGHVRRAMEHFPIPGLRRHLEERYFRDGGREPNAPYKALPMYRHSVTLLRDQITMMANFVEVWLAKEGHDGVVGINLLTKVQMPNLASLYGAMLAGVDYVLMGAGIPREIPGVLDALSEHKTARLRLDIAESTPGAPVELELKPADHLRAAMPALRRPNFIPIVSANSLATSLARKASGSVEGFVVEGPTAGGHNAPPRGEPRFSETGEPLYGERDIVNMEKIRELGLPFWLAGGTGTRDGLAAARSLGAAGIQVGTLFAYCDESGLASELKDSVLRGVSTGTVGVRTDSRASPTGYPFKVVVANGLTQQDDTRVRNCDLGYLRSAYRTPTGKIGYRCAAEPVEQYFAKGGDIADTVGRRCLCNALEANIGQGQQRKEGVELPLITSGDDLVHLEAFAQGRTSYSAADVIQFLTNHTTSET
ncbi:MAG: nitronate monooxygenase [Gemmatimonadota bacterium]